MFQENKKIKSNGNYTAVLVSVASREQQEEEVKEYLDELAFLAQTAGVDSVKYFVQNLDKPSTKTYVGKGKLEEIAEHVKTNKIDFIIFDDELSPSQINNIEKASKSKILDRTDVILFIFEKRANTAQAKLQVELAQLQYTLPRLKKMWTHLERQRGGTGTRGGAGEKEIETDRRIIRKRISQLQKKLEVIEKQNQTQSKRRSEFIRVALVGYTNVGKTTLMNLISKSDLFAENKLFATLDTTVRKVVYYGIPFLLSDTVGFIRKLPHHLVESFKSTLDEARDADILVHVVDLSHPNFEDQIKIVNSTLKELEANPKHTILVFNKIDAYTEYQLKHNDPFFSDNDLEELKQTWMANINADVVFISALKKQNIEEFRNILYEKVKELYLKRFPYKAEFY